MRLADHLAADTDWSADWPADAQLVDRYLDEQDAPLNCCPFCSASLADPGSETLTISIGERPQDFATQLDHEGRLVDVDRLVANGYHSATSCGTCGELLVDYEESGAAESRATKS